VEEIILVSEKFESEILSCIAFKDEGCIYFVFLFFSSHVPRFDPLTLLKQKVNTLDSCSIGCQQGQS
jgi:hypothetical protein